MSPDPTPPHNGAVAAPPRTDLDRESVEFQLNRANVIEGISRRAVHDLRNYLQAITMASETLRDDLHDEDAPELLAVVADAASAADDALRCVGPTPFRIGTEPEPLVLQEPVAWVAKTLTPRRAPDGIDIVVDLPSLPPVRAVEGLLRHVLVNVVLNARESLATRHAGKIIIGGEATKEAVVVSVRDDGPGVDPAIAGRIFEPFFTTKPPAEHFGLGLPVAARLVRQWGGSLALATATEAEAGATFELRLAAARRGGRGSNR